MAAMATDVTTTPSQLFNRATATSSTRISVHILLLIFCWTSLGTTTRSTCFLAWNHPVSNLFKSKSHETNAFLQCFTLWGVQWCKGRCDDRVQWYGTMYVVQWCGVMARVWCDGTVQWCDGAVQWCDGTVQWCDGTVQWCDGAVQWCDGTVQWCDGTVQWCDGAVQWCDGAVQWCDGAVQWCDGAVQCTIVPICCTSVPQCTHRTAPKKLLPKRVFFATKTSVFADKKTFFC